MTGNTQDARGFTETADIETSSDGYACRFEGPVGAWFLEVQERIVLSMLGDGPPREAPPVDRRGHGCRTPAPETSIMDVGGGHGQLALPLCRRGYKVTVLASDESCRQRIAAAVESGRCTFKTGSVVDLPFPDRSFDVVICFRLLPHCTQWQRLIAELCRTAKRSVIVDYPSSRSFNAVAPLLFGAKKKIEQNTRQWRTFRHREIRDSFSLNGFDPHRRLAQFFLPMALHRLLGCRRLSARSEGVFRVLGMTTLFGSPSIVEMRRRA